MRPSARLVALLLVAACTPGRITDTPSGSVPSDTSTHHDSTVVQRATLNVHVAIDDSSDAAIAATAGVTAAGLTVRLTRDVSTAVPQTAVTDAAGNVQFTHLIPASYQLSVERPLTAAELARLTPADREASIFAGGTSVYVSPPTIASYVSLVAARRGSLIISELYVVTTIINGCGGCGGNGHYVEFYNNGDTTAYLDGMLFFRETGLTTSWTGSDPNYPAFSCDLLAPQRLDDTGVWAFFIERFPGTGRDYPVRPGEAKAWAMDAVDHSPLGGGMQNLTGATFESIGSSADPDNPSAANMILMTRSEIGPHGWPLSSQMMIGLAAPIAQDTAHLERMLLPSEGASGIQYYSHFKIPRAAVLDVVGVRPTPERAVFGAYQSGWRECEPWSSPVFERAAARMADFTVPLAISRRSLGFTATGAEILQRTRASARDFVLSNPLLRSLRK